MKNIIEDIFYDSPEVFSVSDTVLRSVKQFLDSFQTVLGTLKKLSDISNSSRNFETVLGSLKKFLEVSKSFRKSQKTVLRNRKQLPVPSIRCRGSEKLLGFLKTSRCYQKAFAQLLRGVSDKEVIFNKIFEKTL